jgi:hypothetical protein
VVKALAAVDDVRTKTTQFDTLRATLREAGSAGAVHPCPIYLNPTIDPNPTGGRIVRDGRGHSGGPLREVS